MTLITREGPLEKWFVGGGGGNLQFPVFLWVDYFSFFFCLLLCTIFCPLFGRPLPLPPLPSSLFYWSVPKYNGYKDDSVDDNGKWGDNADDDVEVDDDGEDDQTKLLLERKR